MAINNTVKTSPISLTKSNFSIGGMSTPAQNALSTKLNIPQSSLSTGLGGIAGLNYPLNSPAKTISTAVLSNPKTQAPVVQTSAPANFNSNTTVAPTTGLVQPPTNTPPVDTNPYTASTSGLIQIGQNGSTGYDKAVQNLSDFDRALAQKYGAIESTPIPLNFQQGREQVIARQASSERDALQQAVNQEQTQQGQQITAFNNAGNLASPVQVPYNNQFINPVTGQPVNGSQTGSLPQDAQNAVNTYAQQVKNGQMTREDAESRLSAYGVAGTNALTQALGSGFNTNASNASAGTTAVGQQVKTAADSTNQALDTLSSAFSALPQWQTGGIPATNSLANWIASNLGSSALTQYKTNLADARSQLIGVLNSSGGTPTGNEATAEQYLPDNMTKAQFDQNVGTAQNPGIVRKLISQKVNSFTGSGSQQPITGGIITTPSGLQINPNF